MLKNNNIGLNKLGMQQIKPKMRQKTIGEQPKRVQELLISMKPQLNNQRLKQHMLLSGRKWLPIVFHPLVYHKNKYSQSEEQSYDCSSDCN